ncbi:MAG: hypothetical protein ABSE56_04840 [Bryobacteraceae bacterium]|jgi:hypothetical protein
MTEACLVCKTLGAGLRQVHVSDANTRSKHDPLSYDSTLAFREVARLIPEHIPLILETPISEPQIDAEIDQRPQGTVAQSGEQTARSTATK